MGLLVDSLIRLKSQIFNLQGSYVQKANAQRETHHLRHDSWDKILYGLSNVACFCHKPVTALWLNLPWSDAAGTHRQLPALAAGRDWVTGWGWLIRSESPSFSISLTLLEQHSLDEVQPGGWVRCTHLSPSGSRAAAGRAEGLHAAGSPCPYRRCWRGKKSGALIGKQTLSSCCPSADKSSADPVPCPGPLAGCHAPWCVSSSSVTEVTITNSLGGAVTNPVKTFGVCAGYSAKGKDAQVQLAALNKAISSEASTSLLTRRFHSIK